MDTITFAQKIKEKYPEYQNVDDMVLVTKMIEKYPVYKSQLTDFNSPSKPKLGTKIGESITQRGQNIQDISQMRQQGQSMAGEVLNTVAPRLASKVGPVISKVQAIREKTGLGSNNAKTGQVAGGINDVIGEVIMAVVPQKAKEWGAEKVGQFVTTQLGQAGINTLEDYEVWAQQNPLSAKNIEGTINVATLLPTTKVASVTGEAIGSGAKVVGRRTAAVADKLTEKAVSTKTLLKGTPEDAALKAVTPSTKDFTPTEYGELVTKGKIKPKDKFKADSYILSKEERQTALKYKDLLQNKDPIENVMNVRSAIAKTDAEVGQFLKENNGVFNKGELRNYLSTKVKDVTDIMVDEGRLEKSKSQLVNNFVSSLEKNNIENLWVKRKEFDQMIESSFKGNPTLQKELKKTLRNGVQDFIDERTPKGVYKDAMKEMKKLYDVEDVLVTKATKQKGMNWFQDWMKKNPTKYNILKYGVGGGAGGVAITSIFN